jgi:SAM-dependent methyltransferase
MANSTFETDINAKSPEQPLTRCPACHSPWASAGSMHVPLRDSWDEMLSGSLKTSLHELAFDRCASCSSLIAVDERRNPELLGEIYRSLPESYWTRLNPHKSFGQTIERHLSRRCRGGDLWDIGCGSGNLLQSLDVRWIKHGIEPGVRAVAVAKQKALDVRLGTAATLQLRGVANAAMMIDVVEHLPDPIHELKAVAEMMRPGGVLAIFTGAADAVLPRLVGERWYYLHCVGHVTIFSRAALRGLLADVGLIQIETERVEHPGGVGAIRWLRRLMGNALRRIAGRPLAAQLYYRDHQLVLASKRA